MLVINAKRFIIVLSGVCIVLFCSFIMLKKPQEDIVQTSSVPVTNRTIVIDSGHRSEKMVVQCQEME